MTNEDRALVAAVVIAAVQALKPLTFVNAAFYGVVAIIVGVGTGAVVGYSRDDVAGIVPGMVGGMEAALIAGGAFGFIKAAGEYVPPEPAAADEPDTRMRRKRDAKGRFVKRAK